MDKTLGETALEKDRPEFDLTALKERRKRRRAAALGLVVALFACIGIVTTIVLGARLVRDWQGHEREREQFETLITPLVMFDPLPFDAVSEAGDATLLQASMWGVLLSDSKSVYAYDDNGQLIIPASDVDVSAAKLFGADVHLNHQTFGDTEMTFTYDATSKSYHVPPVGYLGRYTPEVLSFYRRDGFTILRVGYVSPGYLWSYDEGGQATDPAPAKECWYVLLQNRSGYYVISVRAEDPYGVS